MDILRYSNISYIASYILTTSYVFVITFLVFDLFFHLDHLTGDGTLLLFSFYQSMLSEVLH